MGKYASAHEAARQLNICPPSIQQACKKGCRPQGYSFRFGEPNEPAKLEGEEWRMVENSKARQIWAVIKMSDVS
jgi:hypothetical protein